jgi:type IV secretory pathway VirB6-like protein
VRRSDAIEIRIEQALANRRMEGKVTAIVGNKVAVAVNNGSLTLPRLASYAPAVNDIVHIDAMITGSWLVIGKSA